MIQVIIQLLITFFLIILGFGCIRYGAIKKDGIGIRNIFNLTIKEILFVMLMCIFTMAISFSLIMIYEDNSMIHNIRRILVIVILWVAAYYDYKYMRIPNKLIIVAIIGRAICLILQLFIEREFLLINLGTEILTALVLLIVCVLCLLIVKNGIGMGDIKLFMVMALLQGSTGVFTAIMLSLFIIFFQSIYYLISKKKNKKDAIPFAPSILIGTMLSVFLTGV